MPTSRPAAAVRLLLGLGLILPLASFAPAKSAAPPAPLVPAATIRAGAVQDGDLVFRRGRDLIAASVLAADHAARFSHVGLILRDGERIMVIHAVPADETQPGGVVTEDLAAFLAPDKAADYAIHRPRAITPAQQAAVRAGALAYLGRPFDFDLIAADDRAIYCSELVVRAYARAGIGWGAELRRVHAVMLSEPAIAPDGLRAAPRLTDITARLGTADQGPVSR